MLAHTLREALLVLFQNMLQDASFSHSAGGILLSGAWPALTS